MKNIIDYYKITTNLNKQFYMCFNKYGDVICLVTNKLKINFDFTLLLEKDVNECYENYRTHIEFIYPIDLNKNETNPIYTDKEGNDFLGKFFDKASVEETHGAMKFTIGKYCDRLGQKDSIVQELDKIIDYAKRYKEFLENK